MPRIRGIKPEFFHDHELFNLDKDKGLTRLLFIGLWCHADRDGKLREEPEKLKVLILPWDNSPIVSLLSRLHPKFIIRYEVDGKKYIKIRNWQHQKPHHTEALSSFPDPKDSAITVKQPLDNGGSPVEKEKEKEKESVHLARQKRLAVDIISYLNLQTGSKFTASDAHFRLVKGRLTDGATFEDFKKVIDNKVRDWKDDPKMNKYLRPATLFQAGKFEGYLNERRGESFESAWNR